MTQTLPEALVFLVGQFKGKAENILELDAKDKNFSSDLEKGKLFAYAEALDIIRIIAELNEISLDIIGFDEEFSPYDVLSLSPKNCANGLFAPSP